MGPLAYELEYILAGKASDRENLEAAVQKILLIRLAANFAYIQTDSVRKAEASAMAGTLCALLAVPAVIQAVTQGHPVCLVLRGEHRGYPGAPGRPQGSPLVKDSESWQLTLSSLLKLGDGEEWNEGKDTAGGMASGTTSRCSCSDRDRGGGHAKPGPDRDGPAHGERRLDWFRADHCITSWSWTAGAASQGDLLPFFNVFWLQLTQRGNRGTPS